MIVELELVFHYLSDTVNSLTVISDHPNVHIPYRGNLRKMSTWS